MIAPPLPALGLAGAVALQAPYPAASPLRRICPNRKPTAPPIARELVSPTSALTGIVVPIMPEALCIGCIRWGSPNIGVWVLERTLGLVSGCHQRIGAEVLRDSRVVCSPRVCGERRSQLDGGASAPHLGLRSGERKLPLKAPGRVRGG